MGAFSQETIGHLGYYVYVYSNPETHVPFYIGKGKGNRVFAHLKDTSGSDKALAIRELASRGLAPGIELLAYGLDEENAYKVKAAAIGLVSVEHLTNIQKGYRSSTYGRIRVEDVERRYRHEELSAEDIQENVVLIRINRSYHYGMSDAELYECTRERWRMSRQSAERAEFAFSVFASMVLEVYRIEQWFEAGPTYSPILPKTDDGTDGGRLEFVGNIAAKEIRDKYVGKMVDNLFKPHSQSPFIYVFGKRTRAAASAPGATRRARDSARAWNPAPCSRP